MKLTQTEQGLHLTVTAKYGVRADSRSIAEALGIKPRNLMQTIDRYQAELEAIEKAANPENQCYQVMFETSKPRKSSVSGRPERYAMLTENQCYFIGTLSKNTPQVVAFKSRLVVAFAHARRLKQAHDGEYIPFRYLCHDAARAMHQQAQASGSSTPEQVFHSNMERMINKAFGIKPGCRAELPAAVKAAMGSAYQLAETAIRQVLANGGSHTEAYAEAKRRVHEFVNLFGCPQLEAA